MSVNELQKVKEKFVKQLLPLKNVASVGIGRKEVQGRETEELAIIVGVTQKLPPILIEKPDLVPQVLDQFKTDVIRVGEISVLPPMAIISDRIKRIRPAKGGYSIGNIEITAGTFGCVVYRNSQPFILSNAHVLTTDPTKSISSSKQIVQPGIYDGGKFPEDHIGNLEDYIVINPSVDISTCPVSQGTVGFLNLISQVFRRQSRFQALAYSQEVNLIDAAIAKPLTSDQIIPEVEDVGVPTGVFNGDSLLGQTVMKSGRTTGITHGKVKQVDVDVSVGYGGSPGMPSKIAQFTDQILIESIAEEGAFSQGGDSGSIVFVDDGSKKVCGLLFAGNEEGTFTYANRIQNVLQLLNVQLVINP
ncbi:MAG: hypothetical protein ACFE95_15700 [Candidatus Hodarchaeota archaeon]